MAIHRKKANADTEDDGENHEDNEKNEEEVKAHDGPLDEGINVSVIPPYEAPIITPPAPGKTDTAGAILTPDLEAEREGPDLSNDDQKAETSDPKDSPKTSLSNSPIHDSAIKRPPVCRFPWSSDGKDAGGPDCGLGTERAVGSPDEDDDDQAAAPPDPLSDFGVAA